MADVRIDPVTGQMVTGGQAAAASITPPPPDPTLNPTPIYSDPAQGPAPATAPAASPAVTGARPPPDPAQAFQASATAPAAPPSLPDPQVVYDTTTQKSTASSGMSKEGAERQGARVAEAGNAQRDASQAETEARQQAALADEDEQRLRLNEAAEQEKKRAAEQAVNDYKLREVESRYQAASDWRPDRTELFSGSTGAARGVLAAISVIAGGWMQGRGMTRDNQFLGAITKMIDDNVADQVRKNSQTIQFLRERKGDLQSAAAELKKRQMQYATQTLEARAALNKAPAVQAGIAAFKKNADAQTAVWDADQRKALERTVTETVAKTTAPRLTGAPGKPASEAEMKAAANINEAADILADIDSVSDDDLTTVVGYGNMKPLGILPSDNDVKRTLGLATKGQVRAQNALERYQRLAYMAMTREPNGQLAGILAKVGMPQSDSELPEFKRNLKRELANMRRNAEGQTKGNVPISGAF